MTKSSICCVVPSIRPESMESFREAWAPLFERHQVTLITVWDGEEPRLETFYANGTYGAKDHPLDHNLIKGNRDLFCRRADAIRNLGFVEVASFHPEPSQADFILTLDDDVAPPAGSDPIQEHLDVLSRRVPISWMNTAMDEGLVTWKGDKVIPGPLNIGPVPYLRGFPYGVRDEAPVMVSHGVWVNVPDLDGKTQLELTADGTRPQDIPYSLPYFRGSVPRGCYFPMCGMNVMVRKEALPYLYFAPMGPDSGVVETCSECEGGSEEYYNSPDKLRDAPCSKCGGRGSVSPLNRFADIWCGVLLKRHCDAVGWAIYTGASTVVHTRASDPHKNAEQERLGLEWNEWAWSLGDTGPANLPHDFLRYWYSYIAKSIRFRDLIRELQGAK